MSRKQNKFYKELEIEICKEYKAGVDSFRDVAFRLGTNHKLVGRVLRRNNIKIIKAPPKPMNDAWKRKIGDKSKGRISWNKGIKMPKESVYKNMATHLRFNIEYKWLTQFINIEKLKLLNDIITNRNVRWNMTTEWYKQYLIKFYNDKQFNLIYDRWILSRKVKYKKPSLDHIVPKSKGGTDDLDNLQILSWFENRCKNNMSQKEWDILKENIGGYFVK